MEDESKYPRWAHLKYVEPNLQSISYFAAPKQGAKYESIDDVPRELLDTFDKLGIPLEEQKALAGVAVDAVMDSVSVATTFREELAKQGVDRKSTRLNSSHVA